MPKPVFPWIRVSVGLGALLLACNTADFVEPPTPERDAAAEVDAAAQRDAAVVEDASAGSDAGQDAGDIDDAGLDASGDAGEDAGSDASLDAGEEAGSDAGQDAGSDAGQDAGSDEDFTQVRIMAANLSSGNNQSYDPGHGLRLMQGAQPDVVLIQEFNYGNNGEAAIEGMVQATFPGYGYYRETGAQIPNGVISRFPILDAGEWTDTQVSNRDFAWARIDLPGPRDLWAVSLHLLTRSAAVRNTEATNLVAYIRANVPENDYLAIGGDFNTDAFSESGLATLGQVATAFSAAGPHPADQNGRTGTNAGRSKPYDQILVDLDLQQHHIPTVFGASSYTHGLVLDSRVYTPLAEIAPVQVGDSGANSMQHMGVIKTFRTPNF